MPNIPKRWNRHWLHVVGVESIQSSGRPNSDWRSRIAVMQSPIATRFLHPSDHLLESDSFCPFRSIYNQPSAQLPVNMSPSFVCRLIVTVIRVFPASRSSLSCTTKRLVRREAATQSTCPRHRRLRWMDVRTYSPISGSRHSWFLI